MRSGRRQTGNHMNALFKLFVVFTFALASNASLAEQKKVYGDYEVHYIGLTSSELDRNAAKLYGIPRSRTLGYLSISVLKTGISVMPVAWDATLTGVMSNLVGQEKTLTFTRIQEANALYFYTTFPILDDNMYRFKLKVQPQGEAREYDLKFSQRFYHGE